MTAAPRAGEASGAAQPAGFSVKTNLAWVFTANAFYLASQWVILTTVAKLASPEVVGQISLAFAITAPIFLLSNLRLRTVQASDAAGEYQLGDYLTVRVLTTVAALVVTGGLCLFQASGPKAWFVVMCVALAKAFESGSDLLYGFFQQQDRTSRMTASIMVRGVCSVTAVALVSYFRRDAAAPAAALCVSSVLLFLLCDVPLASGVARRLAGGLRMRWHWPTLRRLTGVSFPLGLSAMLMSLGANMPRYFLGQSLGTREVGIFSAVWYVAMAGGYVVSALAEGSSPRLGRLYAFGQGGELQRLLNGLVVAALLIGAGGVVVSLVAGKTILGLLYNSDYQAGSQLLVWLSLAATAANVASIVSYGMISVRRYRDHLLALVAMTAATGLACRLLIPVMGPNGAAVALLAGYTLQAAWGLLSIYRLPVYRLTTGGAEAVRVA